MIHAIIAAGQGSRIAGEGIALPKPLVQVGGEPLIGRMARIMASQPGCGRIEVIINGEADDVSRYLEDLRTRLPINVTVRTTPGSMHSLAALLPRLGGDDVCVATVDAVFRPDEFGAYLHEWQTARRDGCDALMAVTRYVDDEKPLYVAEGPDGTVTGYFDTPAEGVTCVSGGMYILSPRALSYLTDCMEAGHTRMRDFQRSLVAAGLRLRTFHFSKIIDVDHAADIAAAEDLIKK